MNHCSSLSIYQATKTLLGMKKNVSSINKETEKLAVTYWTTVSKYINEWQFEQNRQRTMVSEAERILISEYIRKHLVMALLPNSKESLNG